MHKPAMPKQQTAQPRKKSKLSASAAARIMAKANRMLRREK